MAMAFGMPAHAIEWRFDPSLTASATYTDNANTSDTDPQDASILTVMPGFSLTSQGSRRVRATLQYGLQAVARFGNREEQDVRHNLGAAGNAELVEDFLYIDGNARVSQELISLFGSPQEAAIDDSNRANVGTYSVSPYVRKRLGTFADAEARYTHSGAIFENDVAPNASVNAFSAGLTSGTRFDDFGWGLNYSIRKTDNRDGVDDTTFERASATAGYALSRKFRVFGTVGQDWNDYFSASDTDGSFYSVGFGWSPMRRASIQAAAGERYFGRTYSLDGTYRTRRSNWTVRYAEDVSDITQQFLEASSRIFWVCGNTLYETPDLNPPGGQADCAGPVTAAQLAQFFAELGVSLSDLIAANLVNIGITNGVYVVKSFSASTSWNVGRLGFGLSVRDTRRLYELFEGAQDRVQSVSGAVSYRLSPKTSLNSSLSLTRNSADAVLRAGNARDDDLVSLSLGLNHRFAQNLSGALTFRHTQRDSSEANADYQENRLTASVNMSF